MLQQQKNCNRSAGSHLLGEFSIDEKQLSSCFFEGIADGVMMVRIRYQLGYYVFPRLIHKHLRKKSISIDSLPMDLQTSTLNRGILDTC